jgi:urea transporter
MMTVAQTTSSLKIHLREYFENVSQALFFRNALFGATLLFISLAFKPQLFACGILASLIGYIYSARYRTPKILKQTGLMTINGFFFGIAMASLFHHSQAFYICLLIGSMALPLVTKAAFEVLQHWKLTPLIVPYILAVWVLYLCANGIALQPEPKIWTFEESFLPTLFPMAGVWMQMFWSMLFSMGQIFFFHNAEYGLFLFLLITVFSPRRGLFFLIGTALATIVFHFISNGVSSWHYGFFSYSAGLVGLGLASLPEKFNWKTILLFSVVSLFLTLALSQVLKGFNLPLLSLPYVVTFWFALLSRVPRLNVSWAPAETI